MSILTTEERDPVRLAPTDLVSSSKLTRSVATYLDAAKKRPLFITRGQEVDAVLLSLDEYRSLLAEQIWLEGMLEEVHALKRAVTFALSGAKTLSTAEVMEEFGISQADIDAVDDEVEE